VSSRNQHVRRRYEATPLIDVYRRGIVSYANPDTWAAPANLAREFDQCPLTDIAQLHNRT